MAHLPHWLHIVPAPDTVWVDSSRLPTAWLYLLAPIDVALGIGEISKAFVHEGAGGGEEVRGKMTAGRGQQGQATVSMVPFQACLREGALLSHCRDPSLSCSELRMWATRAA
eukprot:685071-Pleurochrysis_carterae.AAC.3